MAEPPEDHPASTGEQPAPPRRDGRQLSRRTFLGGAAGVAGLAYLRPFASPIIRPPLRYITRSEANPTEAIGGDRPDFVLSVERPDDLVLLDFAFWGFTLQAGTPPTIVPNESDNTIVVQFPPQAIAEGEYYWQPQSNGNNILPVDPPPILSAVSGPSRLCFNLTLDQSIPLTTMTAADLLDWTDWLLVVPPAAQENAPNGSPPREPTPPAALETSIEFPYALFLAPVVYDPSELLPSVSRPAIVIGPQGFSTEFTSRPTPLVSAAGVTDLWSASLTGANREIIYESAAAPYVPPVSAFWATDYSIPSLAGPSNATPEEYIVYGKPIIIP